MATHTPDSTSSAVGSQVSQIVADAWAATAVVAEEVAPETREAAFQLVLEALLRNGVEPREGPLAASKQETAQGSSAGPIDDVYATEEQRADAVASYLRINYEAVGDLFDLSGDEPTLRMNAATLASSRTAATRQIALC